jgi:hypothetical protein
MGNAMYGSDRGIMDMTKRRLAYTAAALVKERPSTATTPRTRHLPSIPRLTIEEEVER